MKKLLVILLIYLVNHSILACMCDYITNEFCFICYEEADIVAIIEVHSYMSDEEFDKLMNENPKDSLLYFRLRSITARDYIVSIVETFKGNTSSFSELSGGFGSTCDGRILKDGCKYLFYLKSNESNPSRLTYSLCTRNELILKSYDSYVESFNIYDYTDYVNLNKFAKSYFIDSIVQSEKIDILRKLRDKKDGEIIAYYSGYYSKGKGFLKRSNLLNFKGEFLEGKRTGNWEFYSTVSELDSSLKTQPPSYHLIAKGNYADNKKVGEWIYYNWNSNENRWIERKEYY